MTEGSKLKTPDDIAPQFLERQISFLSQEKTAITSLAIDFNFILKAEFIKAFKNLPKLREVVLLGHVNDLLLQTLSEHTRLESVLFKALSGNKFTLSGLCKFIQSQKETLQNLDLSRKETSKHLNTLISGDYDRLDILKSLNECEKLERLGISEEVTDVNYEFGFQVSKPKITDVKVVFASGGTKKVQMLHKIFPKLSSVILEDCRVDIANSISRLRHIKDTILEASFVVKPGPWRNLSHILNHCERARKIAIEVADHHRFYYSVFNGPESRLWDSDQELVAYAFEQQRQRGEPLAPPTEQEIAEVYAQLLGQNEGMPMAFSDEVEDLGPQQEDPRFPYLKELIIDGDSIVANKIEFVRCAINFPNLELLSFPRRGLRYHDSDRNHSEREFLNNLVQTGVFKKLKYFYWGEQKSESLTKIASIEFVFWLLKQPNIRAIGKVCQFGEFVTEGDRPVVRNLRPETKKDLIEAAEEKFLEPVYGSNNMCPNSF